MDFIYDLGFLEPPYAQACKDIDEIEDFYHKLISLRDEIPVMMDGMVIKVDEVSLQEDLGYTVKVPKWMCAYKFPAVEKVTQGQCYYNTSRTYGCTHSCCRGRACRLRRCSYSPCNFYIILMR